MKSVLLPILFYADGGMLAELGITTSETEVRYVRFYTIDNICPDSDEDKTLINSGGETFVCTWGMDKVETLIQKHFQ
jgi:hypothetical protein